MNRWFFYFLKKAVQQRKGRFIISSFSVLLTVSVLTVFIVISTGVRQKIGWQLSAYGANIIVSSEREKTIHLEVARQVSQVSEKVRSVDYHVYGDIKVKGTTVDLIGLNISRIGGFKVQGRIPAKENEVMVGRRLTEGLGLKSGDTIMAEGSNEVLFITGTFEKGTDEDSSIIMSTEGALRLLGQDGISAILMNIDPSIIDQIGDRIKRMFPSLKVKTIRQIALAEEALLKKMELLMFLVTMVVLFSSTVSLGSTMGSNVIERMEEIGVMKAIGAKKADVRNLFLYEALLEGMAGTIAGLIVGMIMAEIISLSAFNSYAPINPLYLLPPFFAGMLLSVIATHLPVKDVMRALPSAILRGE